MNMYEAQLYIGIIAAVLWGCVAFRWLISGAQLRPGAQVMAVVAFASMLVICIFGSLRLLGALSDDMWALTGTVLRAVVALAGVLRVDAGCWRLAVTVRAQALAPEEQHRAGVVREQHA